MTPTTHHSNPPAMLQRPGRSFWKRVTTEREFTEAHDLTRLALACRCLDEIDDDEALIRAEGRYVLDRFKQTREHPAAKAIRENKMLFIKIVRELALDVTAPEARPPRRY